MPAPLRTIHTTLNRVRLRVLWLFGLECTAFALISTIAWTLLAAGLARLGLHAPLLIRLYQLILILSPTLFVFFRLVPRYGPILPKRGSARLLDRRVPDLHNGMLSALELSAPSAQVAGFSAALIDASIRETAARAERIQPSTILTDAPLKPLLAGLTILAFVLIGLELRFPGALQTNLQVFLSLPSTAPVEEISSDEDLNEGPTLGNITLTLVYPPYLNRETRVEENASGRIKAPPGTIVTVNARTLHAPQAVMLRLEDQPPIAATILPDRHVEAEFNIETAGVYRFELRLDDDRRILTKAYPIELELDETPEIALVGLDEVTDVSPGRPLRFSFDARDDHGIGRIRLVLETTEGEQRKELASYEPPRDRARGDVSWYPGEWTLGSASEAWLRLEALDNDTISGPKLGVSRRYRLILTDEQARHEDALKAKDAYKEALISALGEGLVRGAAASNAPTRSTYAQELATMREAMDEVAQRFDVLRTAMENDPKEEIAVFDALVDMADTLLTRWELLKEALGAHVDNDRIRASLFPPPLVTQRRSDLIASLERAILSLESFSDLQRMESALTRGDEALKAGETLMDLLDSLDADNPDTEALLKEVEKMEARMRDLGRELSRLNQSAPAWYQNPTSDMGEARDALSEIKQMVKQGRTKEAKAALEKYLDAMNQMMAQLEEMKSEQFDQTREEDVKDMAQTIDGLKDLEQRQAGLLEDMRAIDREMRKEAGIDEEALDRLRTSALSQVEAAKRSVERAVEAARRQAPDAAPSIEAEARGLQDRLNAVEAALRAKNLDDALQGSLEAIVDFGTWQASMAQTPRRRGESLEESEAQAAQGRRTMKSLADDLEKTLRTFKELERRAAKRGSDLAARQQSLEQSAEELGARLEDYAKDSPMIPGRWSEQLKQAVGSMESAQEQLKSGRLRRGESDAETALREISELRKEMENVQQAVRDRARIPGQAQGQGMPMAGNQGGSSNTSRERWGRRGFDLGHVEISKDYRAPEAFRAAIMEGMKGDAPKEYRGLNREYYEKLVH